jgi:hypothetical protein
MITSDAGKLLIQTCLNSEQSNTGTTLQSTSTTTPSSNSSSLIDHSVAAAMIQSAAHSVVNDNSAANSRMSANGYEEVDLTYQVNSTHNGSNKHEVRHILTTRVDH